MSVRTEKIIQKNPNGDEILNILGIGKLECVYDIDLAPFNRFRFSAKFMIDKSPRLTEEMLRKYESENKIAMTAIIGDDELEIIKKSPFFNESNVAYNNSKATFIIFKVDDMLYRYLKKINKIDYELDMLQDALIFDTLKEVLDLDLTEKDIIELARSMKD